MVQAILLIAINILIAIIFYKLGQLTLIAKLDKVFGLKNLNDQTIKIIKKQKNEI